MHFRVVRGRWPEIAGVIDSEDSVGPRNACRQPFPFAGRMAERIASHTQFTTVGVDPNKASAITLSMIRTNNTSTLAYATKATGRLIATRVKLQPPRHVPARSTWTNDSGMQHDANS